ncbi:MAG: hypothetical protein V4598_05465 [Bdellovibrionota bacterium]
MKILSLIFLFASFPLFATEINFEAGEVSNPYNRVAIPGDDGTQFNLAKAFRDQKFYHRISLSQKFNRHGVRLLYAPLRIIGSATYHKNIDFMGETFTSGSKIDAEYQFNSYRASYFYQVDEAGPWQTRLGVTAKIRDAKTKLSQNGISKTKKNSGLVPLFYLYSKYEWENGLSMALDFDGWAAPQGRAFDVGLMAGYAVLSNVDLNIGYRILEGGVDNDTVYNFSRLEYLFGAVQWEF